MTIEPFAPQQQLSPAAQYTERINGLVDWAQAAAATWKIAQQLAETSHVPKAYSGKPSDVLAAIMAGAELGLNPMASLGAFDVIQGRATPRAQTLLAVALSMGHRVDIVEQSDTRVVVEGQRKGGGMTVKSVWTLERAAKAKLTGKDTWQQHPQAMLTARAISEVVRRIAADALLGIPCSAEELEDGDSPATDDTAQDAAPAGTRRMSRKPKAKTEPAPADEPATEPGATPEQIRQLRQVFTASGADRDALWGTVANAIGRQVDNPNTLTQTEAATALAALAGDQ